MADREEELQQLIDDLNDPKKRSAAITRALIDLLQERRDREIYWKAVRLAVRYAAAVAGGIVIMQQAGTQIREWIHWLIVGGLSK